MKYSRRRSQLETWSLFVLLVGTITLPYFVLLNPLGEQMVQVKHELCAGNQTFVVGRSTEAGPKYAKHILAACSTFLREKGVVSCSVSFLFPLSRLLEILCCLCGTRSTSVRPSTPTDRRRR